MSPLYEELSKPSILTLTESLHRICDVIMIAFHDFNKIIIEIIISQ